MRLPSPLLAALLAGVAFASTPAADAAPLPYRLVIDVAYGEPLGPESVRDELERELTERLEVARCFESVVRATSGSDELAQADLIVEVILDGYLEDTRHDVGIATHERPGEPGSELRWSAGVAAVAHLQVRRASDRAVVKMTRKHLSVTRPAQPAEDTRFEARAELLEAIVREARSYLCKGSLQKWERQIAQARPI